MTFSNVQILQALQAKLKSQLISPTNPVHPHPSVPPIDPNPSVPPSATSLSQQEDDDPDSHSDCKIAPEYQRWDFTVSLTESDSETHSRDDPANPGPSQLSMKFRVRKAKESPVWCLRRIGEIDAGVIYKFADDILNLSILWLVCQAGKNVKLCQAGSCQDSLIDNSVVMATQIVPHEDYLLITMVLHSRTNYSDKSSKAISSCSSYSLDLDPLLRPSNASRQMIGDVGISGFHSKHYSLMSVSKKKQPISRKTNVLEIANKMEAQRSKTGARNHQCLQHKGTPTPVAVDTIRWSNSNNGDT
eukprot:jgi/Psemu1/2069/gm1.2069_g